LISKLTGIEYELFKRDGWLVIGALRVKLSARKENEESDSPKSLQKINSPEIVGFAYVKANESEEYVLVQPVLVA
jgi:hypothetical protein